MLTPAKFRKQAGLKKGYTMRLLCCALLLSATTANACMQGSGMSLDSYLNMPRNTGPVAVDVAYLRDQLKAAPESRLQEFDDWYAAEIPKASEADRGRLLAEQSAIRDILTGNYSTAIETLLAIEATYPGFYATASTLGTAYELAGDNAMAHFWIAKGLERNPDSHYGTEWLHLHILETKIAMEEDANYLRKQHILPNPEEGLPFYKHRIIANGGQVLWHQAMRALRYQLGERMLFVKPGDAVVADLLYTYGRFSATAGDLKSAVNLLELAREYGYYDRSDLESHLTAYRHDYAVKQAKKWTARFLVTSISLFLVYRFFWCICRFSKLLNQYRDAMKVDLLMSSNR